MGKDDSRNDDDPVSETAYPVDLGQFLRRRMNNDPEVKAEVIRRLRAMGLNDRADELVVDDPRFIPGFRVIPGGSTQSAKLAKSGLGRIRPGFNGLRIVSRKPPDKT